MENLRLAMDAALWDVEVASAVALDGRAKAIPGEPSPVEGARASIALRPQQLSLLRTGFPLGIIPSFSPPPSKPHLGSFSLQSIIPCPSTSTWWGAFIAQLRPKALVSSIITEIIGARKWDMTTVKDTAKHFLDESVYALGFFSQFSPTKDTSMLFNVERHGERSERRAKVAFMHSILDHEITLEASRSELFLDRKGTYWNVPLSLSLDVAPTVSLSGLSYRIGLHKNDGQPHALNSSATNIPSTLLPGLWLKAAVSFEKSRDFWRESIRRESIPREKVEESFDERLSEPHSAVSALIGGTLGASFQGNRFQSDIIIEPQPTDGSKIRAIVNMFGSVHYTYQKGNFKKFINDLSRVDARIDIPRVFRDTCQQKNVLSCPTLSAIFQQQVYGPIVFRFDCNFPVRLPERNAPWSGDAILGFSYSLKALKSGKVLAWYSPKRKEGMVDIRLYEF